MPRPTFAEWLKKKAKAAGYDIDSPKGARSALAEATGMSITQIGRTLDGKTTPSAESQVALARALGIPVSEMFVRSGLLRRSDVPQLDAPASGEIDLDDYAQQVGIPEEQRAMFARLVEAVAEQLRKP